MRNTIRATIKSLLISSTIFTLFCLGCTKQEPQTYSGPPTKLVIGIYKGELTSVVYIAEHLGYFKLMGLDVELRDFESGAAAVAALNEGKVDLATAADFVFASNIGKNPDLRAVAAINSANNIFIVAHKDRGITSAADLKGKRIAVTFSTPGEYFLGKQLNFSRLQSTDVTIVNVTPPMMEKGMLAGNFDAVIVWNPVAQRIKEGLGVNAVRWNAQSESNFYMLLMTRESLIRSESPAMIRLMKALILAEKSIESDPVKIQQYIAKRIGMPEKYIADVWSEYKFMVFLDRSLMLTLEEQSRWIQKDMASPENKQPNYLNYLYFDALKTVRPESVTIIH